MVNFSMSSSKSNRAENKQKILLSWYYALVFIFIAFNNQISPVGFSGLILLCKKYRIPQVLIRKNKLRS